MRDHREMVAARQRHRLGAADRVGKALRRPRQLVAAAGDHRGRTADRRQRVAGDRLARAARAGGQRQPVLLLLVGEVTEAAQHRVGDVVGGGRLHRRRHRLGIARGLEDAAADARHHEVIDAARLLQRGGQRDMGAHREAQQVGALDACMVEQREDIARHRPTIVERRVVRLGALAVAAAVQREAAQALAGDGVVPAHALPVLVAVGGEAVHQHDRLAGVRWAEFVVSERKPVGCELSHDFP